jgi:hypothetical protein
MDKKLIVLAMVGGFVGGFVVGYFAIKHHLEHHYVDLANEEIKDAKEYYESVADEKAHLTTVPDDGRERIFYNTLRSYQGAVTTEEQSVHDTAQAVLQNIWRQDAGIEELTAVATPTSERPYVIPVHIFMSNDVGYSQETLTYYLGDQILSDDEDDVIEDIDATVGLRNLLFGHLSNDENVVYVRNEILTLDFEICKSELSYAKAVHDIDPSEVS